MGVLNRPLKFPAAWGLSAARNRTWVLCCETGNKGYAVPLQRHRGGFAMRRKRLDSPRWNVVECAWPQLRRWSPTYASLSGCWAVKTVPLGSPSAGSCQSGLNRHSPVIIKRSGQGQKS